MKFIGFNFTKISSERLSQDGRPGNIKFNTKIDILSVESIKSDFLKTKEEILKVDFLYSVLYEPNFAKLELAGNILISVEPKIAREVLKKWKDKNTPDDFRIFIFNIILRKSNVKALELEDALNIPFHLPFPVLNKDNLKKKD